jgi:hypothetical protein
MNRTMFEAYGHSVVPLFDPAVVRAAQQDISYHVDRVSRALYLPFEASCPMEPLATRLERIWEKDRSQANLLRLAICTDAHRGPRLQALAHAPELIRAAEEAGGRKLGDRIVRVRASIGAFPEHLHPWHSDVAVDDGSDCGRVWVTAWIPLNDIGPDGGGLEVVPGRRTAPIPHRQGPGFAIDDAQLEDQPRMRPDCPAGSAILLDRFTPHRSLPAGREARFALVVWMKAA